MSSVGRMFLVVRVTEGLLSYMSILTSFVEGFPCGTGEVSLNFM